MTDLHERLDDLVADVPSYVVPDTRRAWAAGARRRLRRRIGAGVAVVVLVALAAGLVGVLPRSSDVLPADGESRGVDGYPSRIEKPWLLRDLPDRPGPIAATVELDDGRFLAVSASGEVWRIPQSRRVRDFFPSLSADGRMIGYMRDGGTYVVRDLVAGDEKAFDEIGDNREDPSRPETWWTQQQVPGFWSPDGSTHLLSASRWDTDRSNVVLLLGGDGSLREVERPAVGAYPVGWLDAGALGWLAVEGRPRDATLSLVVTTESGAELKREPLQGARLHDLNQWSGSLSPDGGEVSVTLPEIDSTLVSTFSTADGSRLGRDLTAMDVHSFCSTTWRGEEVILPVIEGHSASLVSLSGERVVAADPALGAYCVMTAAKALDGERHGAVGDLFGTTWLAWHWREVVLGILGAGPLVGAFAWFLRRRGRRLRGA